MRQKHRSDSATGFLIVSLGLMIIGCEQPQLTGEPAEQSNNVTGALVVTAVDPGPHWSASTTGDPLAGLTPSELDAFNAGKEAFEEVEDVPGGLGPRFNSEGCGQCHAQPATGGSSPAINPQIGNATNMGGRNTVPSFITSRGPVRESRFKFNSDGSRDGGVHDLFVITGRSDAPNRCNIAQPDFAKELARGNVIFRIPTPTFGAGLMEQITDSAIIANQNSEAAHKQALGISGHPNRSGNDGTVTRFGWKAQNKSLVIFSGEAYNAEMGVTSPLFPTEREEDPVCATNPTPEDNNHFNESGAGQLTDVDLFAVFMRFLAPPLPVNQDDARVHHGRQLFEQIGCNLCHTPSFTTGKSSTAALNRKSVRLFSDLLVHNMGQGLRDDIIQGGAGPDEFRTAPLWGLGQRLFFLHDGRTSDLVQAILAHASPGSEANRVIANFGRLGRNDQQDLLQFLRSL